jgi:hypothetical protein
MAGSEYVIESRAAGRILDHSATPEFLQPLQLLISTPGDHSHDFDCVTLFEFSGWKVGSWHRTTV